MLVLTGLCLGVVQIPGADVFGAILPALGIALLIGNVYYTYLARRLAAREGRTDVTAMPYGPSVPHMFIVVFVIMLPIYLQTKDPLPAWEAGLAWAFIIGVIVLIGAFVGPYIRKYTPRAAMLGTLAGISITFISMRPAAQMWEALWIALPVLVIILIGFFTDLKLPGNIPVGLAALLRRHGDRLDRRVHVGAGRDHRGAGRRDLAADAATSTCSATGWPTSRRCWPPRSRSASTTSPRR